MNENDWVDTQFWNSLYVNVVLTRSVDSSGYLPTYRPSFLLSVCAGYSGSDVILIVTSRIARERSEARRSLSCPTDESSACAENIGKGGQGGCEDTARCTYMRGCVNAAPAECVESVRGVPCKYLAGIGGVVSARLRKCNGKGGFVRRVRIVSQATRSLRIALFYRRSLLCATKSISLSLHLECISEHSTVRSLDEFENILHEFFERTKYLK